MRIAIFLLLFIFISSLALILLFVPSLFYTKVKNDTINNQLVLTKQKNINNGGDPITFIKNVNRLSLTLSDNSKSLVGYSDIVNKIVSLKNKDIKILSIVVTTRNDTGDKMISIDGIANTRDSLTLFDHDIKIDGFFSNVIFPISNFINSSNSDFSATMVYKNK